MEKEITEIIEMAKAQVDENWPNGEGAPIFENILTNFTDLMVYVAGKYYGFNGNDPANRDMVISTIINMMGLTKEA